ncbi:MAG: UDPglucose 6-dehydrogenase [Halieaceae bacterium]|jgi:UDPglucose 6-dehydrogenase
MKITIFGTGYVGLVTGACLAEVGNDVVCVDIDAAKIERLQQGHIPIYEPDLESLVARNEAAGRLRFTTDTASAVVHGLLQLIAVGTPQNDNGSVDLTYVHNVAASIAKHVEDYVVIITKSTVPVGTADQVREIVAAGLSDRSQQTQFDVVSNPEFLKEGAAIADFMKPDRIVVGTDSPRATAQLRELYAPFNRNRDVLQVMGVRSAELTKYAANVMLATRISFMNEMANIAERVGADIEEIRRAIGADNRIGHAFIYPGCGYGGSCFPKDVSALVHTADQHGYTANIVSAVEATNRYQQQVLFNKINGHFAGELAGKTFALWGLSFKPNTDDMRDAPSRALMEALWAAGAKVQAHDPVAMAQAASLYPDQIDSGELILVDTAAAALSGAVALAIATEWRIYQAPNFDVIHQELAEPVIFDGRNLYDPATMQHRGFTYYGIGRGA